MADTRIRTISAQLAADISPVDVTIPGETRLPTGCVILSGPVFALNTTVNDAHIAFGVTDFSLVANAEANDKDNVTTTSSASIHQETDIITVATAGTSAIVRSANVTAIVGGIRIVCAADGPQFLVMIVLVFGSVCKAYSTNGDGSLVDLEEFQVAHGMTTGPGAGIHCVNGLDDASGNSFSMSIGFHSYDDTTIKQACVSWSSLNSQNPSNMHSRMMFSTRAAQFLQRATGAESSGMAVTGIDTTNVVFTHYNNSSSNKYIGLLIECDDILTDVQDLIPALDDTVDWNFTGLAFEPQAILLAPNRNTNPNNNEGGVRAGCVSFAAMDDLNNELSYTCSMEDNKSPSNSQSELVAAIQTPRDNGTRAFSSSGHIFTANGWTFTAANIITAEAEPKHWPMLAFQTSAIPTAPVLSNPADSQTSWDKSSGSVDSSATGGTLSAVVTQFANTPSHTQIAAGQDHTGAAADAVSSVAAAIGSNNLSFTGLVENTLYFTHFTQSGGTNAIPVSAAGFTTAFNTAPVVVTPIIDQVCTIGVVFGPLDVSGSFADPDSDVLTFSQFELPNGLSISSAGIITGTPTGGFAPLEEIHQESMVVGNAFDSTFGFLRDNYGTLTPDTEVFEFGLINVLTTITSSSSFVIQFPPINVPDNDGSWHRIDITGDFGSGVVTETYLRFERTVYDNDNDANSTRWEFIMKSPMVDGNTYDVKIIR